MMVDNSIAVLKLGKSPLRLARLKMIPWQYVETAASASCHL